MQLYWPESLWKKPASRECDATPSLGAQSRWVWRRTTCVCCRTTYTETTRSSAARHALRRTPYRRGRRVLPLPPAAACCSAGRAAAVVRKVLRNSAFTCGADGTFRQGAALRARAGLADPADWRRPVLAALQALDAVRDCVGLAPRHALKARLIRRLQIVHGRAIGILRLRPRAPAPPLLFSKRRQLISRAQAWLVDHDGPAATPTDRHSASACAPAGQAETGVGIYSWDLVAWDPMGQGSPHGAEELLRRPPRLDLVLVGLVSNPSACRLHRAYATGVACLCRPSAVWRRVSLRCAVLQHACIADIPWEATSSSSSFCVFSSMTKRL
jgi:hypothetical protein